MDKKMKFKYFYGAEADQFSFYRIPKVLFTDSYFKDLSSDAKILYGLMLDRMSLSIKNQWFDEKNRAYIYFSIEDIMELLNCGLNKAIKSMQELDDETGIGLIEKRRQGFGKVNIIYVKTFMPEKMEEKSSEDELKKFKKQTSEENEESTEVYISNPNYTNINDTEMNDNKSNQIVSADENRSDGDNPTEEYQAYENLVKETVDYESLEVTHHDDMRQVDEIVNLIVETVMCKNDKILIASNWYPHRLPIYEYRGHTWCIKPGQKPIYHNNQIQLFISAFELCILSCQAFIQIAIICLDLGQIIFCIKHFVIIIQRLLHLLLINM